MNAKVSIIIPTFNRAHIIEDTLVSIEAQSYTFWECIVVDDQSTDDTKAVIKRWIDKDQRFRYILRPNNRNKGANACRNIGLESCKGLYVNFFDSDDLMDPEKLEVQLKLLEGTSASFTICQTRWADKETNQDLGLRGRAVTSENPLEDYVTFKIFWSILAPLWKKDFLDENNIKFDESLHQSQEYEFHTRALAIDQNYIGTEQVLATMFKHDSNLSNDMYGSFEKMESNLRVKSMIFNNYGKRFSADAKKKLFEIITLTYKRILQARNDKLTKVAYHHVLNNLEHVEAPVLSKLIFKMRLYLATLSYRFLGKGYRILKILR